MSGARLSRAAVAELSDAARRIARDNPQAARGLRVAVGGARSAGEIPPSGTARPELAAAPTQFWFLPRYPYVLVDSEARPLLVLRVVHAARDLRAAARRPALSPGRRSLPALLNVAHARQRRHDRHQHRRVHGNRDRVRAEADGGGRVRAGAGARGDVGVQEGGLGAPLLHAERREGLPRRGGVADLHAAADSRRTGSRWVHRPAHDLRGAPSTSSWSSGSSPRAPVPSWRSWRSARRSSRPRGCSTPAGSGPCPSCPRSWA